MKLKKMIEQFPGMIILLSASYFITHIIRFILLSGSNKQ